MNKHKIEILDMKEKSDYVHKYSIRLDDIPMNCKSVAVFPYKASDMTFRLTFDRNVKDHPDYPNIRRQILAILGIVHGLDLP